MAFFLAVGLIPMLDGGVARADGARSVSVQPLTPKPGDVMNVKGDLLGANSTVEVRIIGRGVDIDPGEVQADAEGDFSAQFRVPEDLKAGNYQVWAKGADTPAPEITVVNPSAATSTGTTAGAEQRGAMQEAAPVLRERPMGESLILVGVFGLLAAAGIFFARTARETPSAGATEATVN